MLKTSLTNVLSEQVNAEYYSAYLYFKMSAYADRMGFKGFANWLHVQAQEEMAHGTHIYQYLLERGAMPSFADIKAPEIEFKNMEEIFAKTLEHEQHVTELINNIASIAMRENDHATYHFILWYVNEQIEEEATADELLTKVRLMGNNTALLYTLDAELATRVFNNPFPAKAV